MEAYKPAETFKLFDPDYSERCFFMDETQSYTYGDVAKKIKALTEKLSEHSFQKDDRVLLFARDKVNFLSAVFACQFSGITPLVCDQETVKKHRKCIEEGTYKAVLTDLDDIETDFRAPRISFNSLFFCTTFPHDLKDIVIPEDDIAVSLLTSGSTGAKKTVEKSWGNLLVEIEYLGGLLGVGGDEKILSLVPFFHIYGFLFSLILPSYFGVATNLSVPYSPGSTLSCLENDDYSVIVGTPTHFRTLIDSARGKIANHKIKLAISSAGRLPPKVRDNIHKTLDCKVLEIYGSTETGGIAQRLYPDEKSDSSWKAFDHVSVRLGEESVLMVKSPTVSEAYTDEDGFFKTFDIVSNTKSPEDGFQLIGRARELLKVGGNRVSAPEIEEVIKNYPVVLESVVLGTKEDGIRETQIVAFIELREKAEFNESELRSYLGENLSPYQMPKKIIHLESIPKNNNGKIAYPQLEEMLIAAEQTS